MSARKTQVAINHAFQLRHSRSILWIDGYTAEKSMSSLLSIANQIGLATAEMNEKGLSQALKKFLGSDESGNWLAIVDDLTHTDPHVLDILSSEKGTLVVTTRQEDIPRHIKASQLECGSMNTEEARATFHRISGLDVDDKKLDGRSIDDLLKALEHFPLAVALAASFIRETKMSVEEYTETYQKALQEQTKLTPHPDLSFGSAEMPPLTVMSTLSISFSRIKRDRPSALDLLQFMSTLDSHNVPMHLLNSKVIGKDIGLEEKSKLEVTLGTLLSFSLLSMRKDHGYEIHDLVSTWTRRTLSEKDEHVAKLALTLMENIFADQASTFLLECLPHAHAVIKHSREVTSLVQQRISFQRNLADLLHQSAMQAEAKYLANDCLEYYTLNKKDSIEYAECAYLLARISLAEKNYEQAILLCSEARDGFSKNLGQSHARTLGVLTRIAVISEMRGEYMNAIQHYEQALAWSNASAADHFTIDTIHSMALVFDKQGRYSIAIEAYTQALSDAVEVIGDQHPYTLDIRNNMAITLRKQGKYDEALKIFKEVAKSYAQILGRSHPSTLNVEGNIALIDDIQGRHTVALKTYQWVLELKEDKLGKTAPSTLSTLTNLSLLLSKLQRHDEAVKTAQRALDGYHEALGDDDPATLDAVANCAVIFTAADDIPTAKEYFEHACWQKAKLLGMEHPSTLATLAAFAALVVRLGNFEEALGLQESVVGGYKAVFGKAHPFSVEAESGLAKTLESLGRWEEAKKCLNNIIEASKRQEGLKKCLEAAELELKSMGDRIARKGKGFGGFGVVK
jgi:tetratricopeptide (TPR) repeat protein